MALSHKLELRQSQSLVMTPQLMQAIKLLQLSNLDLIAYVDAELERNPLLERGETEEGGEAPEERPRPMAKAMTPTARPTGWRPVSRRTRLRSKPSSTPTSPTSFPTTTAGRPPRRRRRCPSKAGRAPPTRQAVSSEDYNLEAFVAEEKTLARIPRRSARPRRHRPDEAAHRVSPSSTRSTRPAICAPTLPALPSGSGPARGSSRRCCG